MPDPLGQAISDYHSQHSPGRLWIHNKYGEKEEMPVDVYFRDYDHMPLLEQLAMNYCRGSILDIGAGAGSHALYLQQRGETDVTALEISPLSCAVMRERGVQQVVNADIRQWRGKKFDTVLMLMNGIGLSADLAGLAAFLRHAAELLTDGGQLLFDSSDVAYLFEGAIPQGRYYGEIDYKYTYKKLHTEWFSWLYVDFLTLRRIAAETGWKTEKLMEDDHYQFLVRLTRNI
ncbi:MAG: class I SAM-dependent methyltransferase [Chitinophagaceae bacterium]|nr:MAG: class I SAM-dependent methyltransferase [Chitinophagaceae bacterium]